MSKKKLKKALKKLHEQLVVSCENASISVYEMDDKQIKVGTSYRSPSDIMEDIENLKKLMKNE